MGIRGTLAMVQIQSYLSTTFLGDGDWNPFQAGSFRRRKKIRPDNAFNSRRGRVRPWLNFWKGSGKFNEMPVEKCERKGSFRIMDQ